ncbi:MAG: bifunctional oligoribonuclease/PAP phosphatase NrnA [Fibrobacter sp.]|jgi:phosphoesterase RecJ-like protein|nr:bifunctional oligoribonuclease/PAP phosphatase NrnA [Fibrobacter sp.]
MPVIANQMWAIRNLELIKAAIEGAKSVLICGHCNPDGDSMGAILSLGLGLESLGKRVFMLCTDPVPNNYRTLPGAKQLVGSVSREIDLGIAVDCGSKEMMGPAYAYFKRAAQTIEIDHHRSRISFADLSMVDSDACSAGELVYELLSELGVLINNEIAQNVLTSIIVETNSFRLPGIRSRTFEICAELIRTGLDFQKLAETVYWVTSRQTALLSGICMSRCRFIEGGEIAWTSLTRKDFLRASACDADADKVPEKIRSIQGVKLAVLFREREDLSWRVSLRSKDGIDVAKLAERFGGGGHKSAAGFTIASKKKSLRKILDAAVDLLSTHRKSLIKKQGINSGVIDAVTYYEKLCSKDRAKLSWQDALYTEPLSQKIAF